MADNSSGAENREQVQPGQPALPQLKQGQIRKLTKAKENCQKKHDELKELCDTAMSKELSDHVPQYAVDKAQTALALLAQSLAAIELTLESGHGDAKEAEQATTAIKGAAVVADTMAMLVKAGQEHIGVQKQAPDVD